MSEVGTCCAVAVINTSQEASHCPNTTQVPGSSDCTNSVVETSPPGEGGGERVSKVVGLLPAQQPASHAISIRTVSYRAGRLLLSSGMMLRYGVCEAYLGPSHRSVRKQLTSSSSSSSDELSGKPGCSQCSVERGNSHQNPLSCLLFVDLFMYFIASVCFIH